MDQFDHPFGGAGEELGPFTIVTYLLAFTLCLMTCLLSLSQESQIGPEIGEIVTFDPGDGPKYWDQPGIPAVFASDAGLRPGCLLMPPVIAAGGGSFVIEAKQTMLPPVFAVHWSGLRTDRGAKDCGRSADLRLTLNQVRALANVAGGFGVQHEFFRR